VVNVPCNGCKLCCRKELILILPGESSPLWQTEEITINPLRGDKATVLKHKQNGDCVHLGDNGCTIHGHAPHMCREYDCRRAYLLFQSMPRNQRKRRLRMGLADKERLEAGRSRLDSLSPLEKIV